MTDNIPEFFEYPSIEDMRRRQVIKYIQNLGYDQLPWQVGLKVHGANLQSITTFQKGRYTTMYGRKTGYLEPDEYFYDHRGVMTRYQKGTEELYRFLKTLFPSTNTMTLYGEIFGGMYNHPDVEKEPRTGKVMKGVNYCPHIDFFLTDIRLDETFINKLYVTIACKTYGFIGNIPLLQASLRECMEYPNEFPDPLHKIWDLPSTGDDNICEGVVLEPEEPKFFDSGTRVILKNKSQKFREKANKSKKVPKLHDWSVEGAKECSIMSTYVTKNRLSNVISHFSTVSDRDFGKIMGEMSRDVFKAYIKDREEKYHNLSDLEQQMFKKAMNRYCTECIKEDFVNILDRFREI